MQALGGQSIVSVHTQIVDRIPGYYVPVAVRVRTISAEEDDMLHPGEVGTYR